MTGEQALGPLGFAVDEQGDTADLDGPDKAIPACPSAHYAAWTGDAPELLGPPVPPLP